MSADIRAASMGRVAILLFAASCSLSVACSSDTMDAGWHDPVRAAAQDLRWTNGTDSAVTVPLTQFERPVVVLVLPPGKYQASDLEPLLHHAEARQWVEQWMRDQTLDVDCPSLHVFRPTRAESTYYDQLSVPKPLALWKQDEGPLDVSLRRVDDDVHIIALK